VAEPAADNPPATTLAQATQADPRVAELEQKLAAFEAEKRLSGARSTVAALLEDRRLLPKRRELAVALVTQLAADDAASSSSINFSNGDGGTGAGSRVELLSILLGDMPQHELTKDHPVTDLPEGAVVLNPNSADLSAQVKREAEVEKLLSQTEEGRKVLAKRKAAAAR
jgi:hypothetical protein